jgi:hypothetical protein
MDHPEGAIRQLGLLEMDFDAISPIDREAFALLCDFVVELGFLRPL